MQQKTSADWITHAYTCESTPMSIWACSEDSKSALRQSSQRTLHSTCYEPIQEVAKLITNQFALIKQKPVKAKVDFRANSLETGRKQDCWEPVALKHYYRLLQRLHLRITLHNHVHAYRIAEYFQCKISKRRFSCGVKRFNFAYALLQYKYIYSIYSLQL